MSGRWRLEPGGRLRGTLDLPGDKSISHRALLLAALADGDSRLVGVQDSEDCRATARAIAQLGVPVAEPEPGVWTIRGRGPDALREPDGPLDLGNSGTAMRLLCGLLAARPFRTTLLGDASLSQRPMERVAQPLRAMGAALETTSGHAPVQVGGQALRGTAHAEPIASAQVKSALLLAGLQAPGRTCLTEAEPSRNHTELMLPAFGGACAVDGARVCIDGPQVLRGSRELAIPRDLSAAAFFVVGALIAPDSELALPRVGLNPRRDGVLRILQQMGGDVAWAPHAAAGGEPLGDIAVRSSELHGIDVDPALASNAIDEFPILCIAAACARGTTVMTGLGELRVKESDRIAAMAEGLAALGVPVETGPDWMRISGHPLGGGRVHSHGDHRIAMAFAIAALAAQAPITIADAQWAATSFPDFARLAAQAGLRLADA